MGRAPTSGYCHTCRRRRVKCDKGRPECGRCLKSGHRCQGYELPLRMQNYTVSGESSGSQTLVPVTTATEVPTFRPRPRVVPELPLSAFRNSMAFSHLLANYRWAPFWKPLLRTQISEGSTKADKAHYTAGLATALAYMGTLKNEPKMVSDGYEKNGEVIRALHWALLERSKPEMARWALTILVLCMYQYAVETEPNLPHYHGVVKVIEFCGPEYFQREPMLTIFRQIRAQHSCSSFFHKEPSFFGQERWKTTPWGHNPKTMYDRLIDMYIDLPELGALLGPSSSPLTEDRKLEAEMKAKGLLSRLHDWRRDWEVANPKAATEVWLPLDTEDVKIPWVKNLVTKALDVQTANQATDLLIYNSTLIYVMQALAILRTGIREPQPFPAELDPAVEKTAEDPLYMPQDLKYQWQPLLETLRIMRLAPGLLAASNSTVMLAVSVIGIVYNYIKATEGLGRILLSTMNNPEQYEAAASELRFFQLPQ
ncbi:C6 finger domain-containing protein [Colletotrichum karsti]|uniref:C6 finger domain-containing protein n=1 Tax=Colletotrichum karsti TaxID=1095194 RepID=A0A9P6IAK5_9PEZI|nr:C6 finger domain-containing protein [Colletotrichum karsti]KAF9878812.1 C6 finger domain-containing protein [Colletotrichum karsti]